MISIASSNLRDMFQQVTPHMDDPENYLPAISSIRLEARGGWLYAVATDRYTIAAARRPIVNDGDRTGHVPGRLVPAVQSWLEAAAENSGEVHLNLPTDDGSEATFSFAAVGRGELAVEYEPDDYKTFPNWRKLFHSALTADPGTVPVSGLTTSFLARWQHAAEKLAFWQSEPRKPIVFLSHDDSFVGMQQPTRVEDRREDIAASWIAATVHTVTVDGITYDLDKTWEDRDDDPWAYSGSDTPDGMPLMVIDGIEDDPHPLDWLITQYGPLYAADL